MRRPPFPPPHNGPRTPITSPPFPLGQRWLPASLVLYPERKDHLGWTAIYLNVADKHKAHVAAKLSVSYCLDLCNGTVTWSNSKTQSLVTTKDMFVAGCGWGFAQVCQQSQVTNATKLYIKTEIEVHILDTNIFTKISKVWRVVNTPTLGGSAPDVILKVGDEELKAHKAVLSDRSLVFKAMLEADMSEGLSGVVTLEGISATAASALLDFFYGREFSLWRAVEPAIELLNAANMYDLPELVVMCENSLRSSLSVSSVGRVLEAACLYDLAELKVNALDFIARNKEAVTATAEWAVVVDRSPQLIVKAVLGI